MSERLLREYVREVLREDDTGAVWADLHAHDMMMNPYGAHFGSGADLFKIFVKPFIDVFDTTMGKTKELTRKAITVAHVAFEAIITSLVPIFSDSYKEIFAEEKKQIDAIKKEYAEVYQSNWDAFRDNDVFWTAFCYAPWAIMTIKFIKHSPKAAGRMTSAMTGGKADKILSRLLGDWNSPYKAPKTGLNYNGSPTMGVGYGAGGNDMFPESVLREYTSEDNRLDRAAKVLSSDEFVGKLKESPIVQKMSQDAQGVVRGSLSAVFKQASAVMRAKTLQELQQKTGKRPQGVEKLAQMPPEERQKAEAAILNTLRQTMKNFYVKNLEGQVAAAVKAGVPETSPYVQDIQSVIAKIKAL